MTETNAKHLPGSKTIHGELTSGETVHGELVPGGIRLSDVTVGEDIHDRSTDLSDKYIRGADEYNYDGWKATDYIPLEDGKWYMIYASSVISGEFCSEFDADKKYLDHFKDKAINSSDPTVAVMLKGNGGYMRFSGSEAQIDSLEVHKVEGFNWDVAD